MNYTPRDGELCGEPVKKKCVVCGAMFETYDPENEDVCESCLGGWY